jgi:hypothetical protein
MTAAHDRRLIGQRLHEQGREFDHPGADATALRARRVRVWPLLRDHAIWILSGIILGAAAGWTVFRAFLTLVTLD